MKTRWSTRDHVCCNWYLRGLIMVHQRGCPNRGTDDCAPVFFVAKTSKHWNLCDYKDCHIKRPHTHGLR